jgi:hypothetical protein
MYPVTVSIRRELLRETPCLGLAGMIDILWAHAVPADGLEHIGQRVDCETADLVFFMKSTAQENACQAALEICRRMLSASPALADWKLVARNVKDAIISITSTEDTWDGADCG